MKSRKKKTDVLLELEKSRTRLKLAVESTGLGIWEWNPKDYNLFMSEECKGIFGIQVNEKITYPSFMNRIYPEDMPLVVQVINNIDASGHAETCDVVFRIYRFNDNCLRWVKIQWKQHYRIEDHINLFIGSASDISDIKSAEEKSAKLAAIVESSNDTVISKTLHGIVTSWNDSAERIFGYREDEMIGQPILKLIPEDRKDEETLILSRLSRGETVSHFETIRMTKNGTLIDVSLTISPVRDNQGRIIGLSKIVRDITEKKLEEQKRNDFVAMVSHELKTPLTALMGYHQLLIAHSKKGKDEFTTISLIKAENQIKKMVGMIQDFLNLARLEEGKMHVQKESFELHSLMTEIAEDAKFQTATHIIRQIGLDQVTVNGDKNKIGHVLMNLIGNAIKYSPDGGVITFGYEKQNGKVKIYVSDQGIGISPADQKRLFERFYRVNNNRIKTIPGFGIGLYLVAEILRYHESEIRLKSEENVGSTFYFTLDVYN